MIFHLKAVHEDLLFRLKDASRATRQRRMVKPSAPDGRLAQDQLDRPELMNLRGGPAGEQLQGEVSERAPAGAQGRPARRKGRDHVVGREIGEDIVMGDDGDVLARHKADRTHGANRRQAPVIIEPATKAVGRGTAREGTGQRKPILVGCHA